MTKQFTVLCVLVILIISTSLQASPPDKDFAAAIENGEMAKPGYVNSLRYLKAWLGERTQTTLANAPTMPIRRTGIRTWRHYVQWRYWDDVSGVAEELAVAELFDYETDPNENASVASVEENRQLAEEPSSQRKTSWPTRGLPTNAQ